jgi:hypothetical protein
MSADNGYVVSHLYDDDKHVGIFYYNASSDEPPQWFTKEHAEHVYDDNHIVQAVLRAHVLNEHNPTEYGVHVNSEVLRIWASKR